MTQNAKRRPTDGQSDGPHAGTGLSRKSRPRLTRRTHYRNEPHPDRNNNIVIGFRVGAGLSVSGNGKRNAARVRPRSPSGTRPSVIEETVPADGACDPSDVFFYRRRTGFNVHFAFMPSRLRTSPGQ